MPEIRLFTPEDAREVSELEKAVFGSSAWTEKDFLESLALSYTCYLIAREGDALAGSCGLRNMCGEADITNVMVAPEYRRQGIGELMLRELMRRGREMGIRAFCLEVRLGNLPAIRLYEKLGFVQEGIRPRFYTDPVEDARIMWKREEEVFLP